MSEDFPIQVLRFSCTSLVLPISACAFQYHDGIQILHPPSSSTRFRCVLSNNLSHSKVGFSLCLCVMSTRRNLLLSRVFADMLSDDVVHRSLNHDHTPRDVSCHFIQSFPLLRPAHRSALLHPGPSLARVQVPLHPDRYFRIWTPHRPTDSGLVAVIRRI